MNTFALCAFSTSIFTLLIGLFVFYKSKRVPLNRIFLAYSGSIAYWALLTGIHSISKSGTISLLCAKYMHIGVSFIPTLFFHFIYVFLRLDNRKGYRSILILGYSLSILFSIAAITGDFIVRGVRPKLGYTYFMDGGSFYSFLMAFFMAFSAFGLFLLFKSLYATRGLRLRQMRYLFFGSLIGYVFGAANFLPVFDITIPPYPYGSLGITFYVFVFAYAIVKYNLLEIGIIIKRTLVFAGLFAMVMGIVIGTTSITQNLISKYLAIPPIMTTIISVLIVMTLFDPTRKLLVKATDNYLFQKKEDIKVVLNRLSKNIITILDIDKVGKTILGTLRDSLRLEAGVILTKDESGNAYDVLDSFGVKDLKQSYNKDDYFFQYLTNKDQIISAQNQEEKSKLPIAISGRLDTFKGVMCIPLFIHTELIGVLILGRKKSDQEFTQDEIDYFPTMAGQVGVALSNARLYDNLKKREIDFAQQAKMAAIGTLSAGIGHEIKNPLNHIKVGIAMLRMNRKYGLYDKMNRIQIENEIFETLDKLDENVDRANLVIERLSSFAKKPRDLEIQPVDLKQVINAALSFVETELKGEGIGVEIDFPDDFPFVQADRHTMEDVFLNLIVNARHAISHGGKIVVRGTVQDSELDVSIQDTGAGITKENLEKIFDPFFTTKDVTRGETGKQKGTGLGLFIVREFIKRFDGRITVESEKGEGTTFHILFPKATWVSPVKG